MLFKTELAPQYSGYAPEKGKARGMPLKIFQIRNWALREGELAAICFFYI